MVLIFLNFILRVMLTVNLTVQRRKLLTPIKIYWLVFYDKIHYRYTNCLDCYVLIQYMNKLISLLIHAFFFFIIKELVVLTTFWQVEYFKLWHISMWMELIWIKNTIQWEAFSIGLEVAFLWSKVYSVRMEIHVLLLMLWPLLVRV